ncbi:hypothetical protein ACQP08_18935 [Micromonospora zamorensis]
MLTVPPCRAVPAARRARHAALAAVPVVDAPSVTMATAWLPHSQIWPSPD